MRPGLSGMRFIRLIALMFVHEPSRPWTDRAAARAGPALRDLRHGRPASAEPSADTQAGRDECFRPQHPNLSDHNEGRSYTVADAELCDRLPHNSAEPHRSLDL